ncbi:MAG: PQQ-binding-like beta-propeller repeat protein [Calditrichia bacterium]
MEKQFSGNILGSPALTDTLLVFGGMNGSIYCLSQNSGETVWQFGTGHAVSTAPVISKWHGLHRAVGTRIFMP